jgi:endonuclease YncB( thermonuclease family)
MSSGRKCLLAVMGMGLAFGLMAGVAHAGTRSGEVPARTAGKVTAGAKGAAGASAAKAGAPVAGGGAAAARGKRARVGGKAPGARAAAPIAIRIRPAQVAAVPPPVAREPVLLPVAMEEPSPPPARPAKAIPVRAYALDGSSFYQNGQLIRVQGLADPGVGGEHAKQRLQHLLDGGQLSVLPVDGGPGGEMLAVVRVNGRDVAEALTDY